MDRLYWIGSINDELYSSFSKELYKLEQNKKIKEVSLEVSSEGGSSDNGLALYGRVLSSRLRVSAIGHGLVHSAAVAGFAACSFRMCTPECTFLIHNTKSKTKGDYRDIKKSAEYMTKGEIQWADILERHTHMPAAYWRELSDKETYLTAREALNTGLVHAIKVGGKNVHR